jgi:uncharacterized glyoxalase superfamily protein PhnB
MAIVVHGVTPLVEVFDVRKAVAFYREVLGFEVVHAYEPEGHLYWAMLKLGGATVMLNARYEDDERPAAPDLARVKGHDDTVLYFDCADVEAAFAHLKAKGVKAEPPTVTHYGMKQVMIQDPDGFRLCFQQTAAN